MITIWRAALELSAKQLARCAALLSADERERAGRFRTPALRDRYIAGRGQLRQILAAELGQSPGALSFTYGEHQKPHLNSGDLHFNLTHTDQHMLCALSRDHTVGIDLEDTRREVEIMPLAEEFFAPEEVTALHAASGSERRWLFFQLWTRKEAYLKARGWGVAHGDFARSLLPDEGRVLTGIDGTRWQAVTFVPFPHHCATLVTNAPSAVHRLVSYSPR